MTLHKNFINGEWVEGKTAKDNINPSDLSDIVGSYAQADQADTEAAIAAAKAAAPAWAATTPQQRADMLEVAGVELLARKDEIGKLLAREEGKTLANGIAETMRAFVIKKVGETGVVEKPIPEPGPEEAIVRTTSALICTSDVHTVKGAASFLEFELLVKVTHKAEDVLNRLEQEYQSDGKSHLFAALKQTLLGSRETQPYAELAPALGMSESAVKVAVHRLRKRYRDLIRDEIANTLDDPREVEAEMRYLFQVLSR